VCNPGHRVSRPRGTGSVGDSVGEGRGPLVACAGDVQAQIFKRQVTLRKGCTLCTNFADSLAGVDVWTAGTQEAVQHFALVLAQQVLAQQVLCHPLPAQE